MTLVQNFPFAAIMMCLGGGVTCAVLKPRMSRILAAALNILIAGMMAAVLHYTAGTGESYHYLMGHFPAPWGNEIRIGPLEALMGLMFPLMTAVILAGGMNNILEDVEPGKTRLYSAMICLMTASLLALTFTNDLFTAYVFVEINTLTSCALVMLRYKSGTALSAAIRYLIMSLLGSGLFLIGVVILYNITGHLLMEPIGAAVRNLAATGEYAYPLTITLGLFSVGLHPPADQDHLPDAGAGAVRGGRRNEPAVPPGNRRDAGRIPVRAAGKGYQTDAGLFLHRADRVHLRGDRTGNGDGPGLRLRPDSGARGDKTDAVLRRGQYGFGSGRRAPV